MSEQAQQDSNAQQKEYWNGDAGEHWREQHHSMEAMLHPLGAAAVKCAAVQAGEQVIDIGCGCGATSFDLLSQVGANGRVVGVDISQPMLALTKQTISAASSQPSGRIEFIEADASSYNFPPQQFDLLFSRFGIMFFDQPIAAFNNLRKALKPGGRISFLCWGEVKQNQWITVPMMAAMQYLPATEPADPRAPGPFAFADQDYLHTILSKAGFEHINFKTTTPTMNIGKNRSLEQSTDFFMDMGPVSRALQGQPTALREQVKQAISVAIAKFEKDGAIALQANCTIVTAQNPTG